MLALTVSEVGVDVQWCMCNCATPRMTFFLPISFFFLLWRSVTFFFFSAFRCNCLPRFFFFHSLFFFYVLQCWLSLLFLFGCFADLEGEGRKKRHTITTAAGHSPHLFDVLPSPPDILFFFQSWRCGVDAKSSTAHQAGAEEWSKEEEKKKKDNVIVATYAEQ